MFKAAAIYQIKHSSIGQPLGDRFDWKAPEPRQAASIGLVRPRWAGSDYVPWVTVGNGVELLSVKYSWRELPGGVVNDSVQERVDQIDRDEGRAVGRKERQTIKEEIIFELLPQAFVKHRTTPVAFVAVGGRKWLVVGSATANEVDRVLDLLRHMFEVLQLEPADLDLQARPALALSYWLSDRGLTDKDDGPTQSAALNRLADAGLSNMGDAVDALPAPWRLDLADECTLVCTGARTARFKGVELPADEPTALIEQGFHVERLGLVNGARDRFTVDLNLRLRGIKFAERTEGEEPEDMRAQVLIETGAILGAIESLREWLGVE